jgi:hypothetical protein
MTKLLSKYGRKNENPLAPSMLFLTAVFPGYCRRLAPPPQIDQP